MRFNLTAGNATLFLQALSANRGCSSYTIDNASSQVSFVSSWISIPTGNHRFVVNWTVAWTINISVVVRRATSPPNAYAWVDVDGYVLDSRGGSLFSTQSWFAGGYSSTGTYRGYANATVVVPAYLRAGAYSVITFVEAAVTTFIPNQGGTSMASVNVATGGNFAHLNSISVS